MAKKKRYSGYISVTPTTHERLKQQAKAKGISIARLIDIALTKAERGTVAP